MTVIEILKYPKSSSGQDDEKILKRLKSPPLLIPLFSKEGPGEISQMRRPDPNYSNYLQLFSPLGLGICPFIS